MTLHRHLASLALLAALGACARSITPPDAVASASAPDVAVGAIVQLDASGSTDTNTPALPLFFQWTFSKLPPGSEARLNDPAIVNPSFLADVPGIYEMTLVASNGIHASAPATVSVEAGPCGANRPVVAEISSLPVAPRLEEAVLLSADAFDPDNREPCAGEQTLSYAWSIVSLPAGSNASLNLATSRTPSFVADVEGAFVIELVITDSTGRSSAPVPYTVDVSGCGGAAPVVEAPVASPVEPNIGQLVQLTAAATDPDNTAGCDAGQTLSFSWFFVSLPTGSRAALNDAAIANPSFVPDLAGAYVVRSRVTDSTGRSTVSAPLTLEVSSCGGARPVVQEVSSQPVLPNSGQIVQFTAQVSDADSFAPCEIPQSFTYAWRLIAQPAGSVAALNNPNASNPSFLADVPGEYVASVEVTDDTGLRSRLMPFSVQVSQCGSAVPSAGIAVQSGASIGSTVTASAVVSDADTEEPCSLEEVFTYAWAFDSLPPGSQARLNATGIEQPSFTPDMPGDYVLRLVATDSTGRDSAPVFATVEVSQCGGSRPVALPSVSNDTPGIGEAVQLIADASDADNEEPCEAGQTFTWAWAFDAVPAGSRAVLHAPTAARPTFTPDVAGAYVVRLVTTDSTGRASVASTVTVNASSCGGARPVASIDASNLEPGVGQPVLLTAAAEDADNLAPCSAGQNFTWAWSLDSLPAGSTASLNSTTATTPSFTPDRPGTYVARLMATDSTGLASAPVTLAIEVSSCGAARPVAAIDASSVNPGVGQPVLLTASAEDADNLAGCDAGQTFTWAWSLDAMPAGSSAALNSSSATSPSFVPDLPGTYVARLVATDSTGLASEPVTVSIEVSTCGAASPQASASASPLIPAVGQPVLLTASATDADNLSPCEAGQTFTYLWAFEALPAGSQASLNTSTAVSPSFVPDVPGAYTLKLVATDSTGRTSAPATVTVSASTCGVNAPVAEATASSSNPAIGQAVRLTGSFEDADIEAPCTLAQTHSFAWAFARLPAGSLAALNSTTAVTPSFVPDVAGEYELHLVVTDSAGLSSAPFAVVVTADECGGNAPTVNITASPSSVGVGMAAKVIANANDADNGFFCQNRDDPNPLQTLSYAWTLLSAPAGSQAVLSSRSAREPSFVADVAGPYQLEVVVTDSTGRSGRNELTLFVNVCGSNAPVVTSVTADPGAPNAGQPVELLASFDDADNGAACQAILGAVQDHSVEWRVLVAPAGSGAGSPWPASTVSGFVPDLPGEYQLQLTVTDSTGRRGSEVVDLWVSECGTAPPTVNPVIDVSSSLRVGGLVALLSNAADADNEPSCGAGQSLSYNWQIVEQPAGSRAHLDNPWARNASFTPDVGGEYVVSVQVIDSTGRSSESAMLAVTVSGCGGNAPTAVITGPSTASLNQWVQFDGSASTDADNDIGCSLDQDLHFRWELFSAPAGASVWLTPSSSVVNPSLQPDQPGTYVLRLEVTDSTGLRSGLVEHAFTVN